MSSTGKTAEFACRLRAALGSAIVVVSLFLVTFQSQAARICTITVTPLAFGTYMPGTPAPVDSTALIQVSCIGDPDPGQPGFYTLGIGGGTSGNPASRYMPSAGPTQLSYNLFQDAGFTTVWGDGTSGTSPIAQAFPGAMGMGMGMGMGLGLGNGMGMGMGTPPFNANHTVYGRAPAGQDPAPGTYSDTPIVTIEF